MDKSVFLKDDLRFKPYTLPFKINFERDKGFSAYVILWSLKLKPASSL